MGILEERAEELSKFFTSEDDVFALINLPAEVQAALFARYARTNKSVKEVFLGEFANVTEGRMDGISVESMVAAATSFHDRVFIGYGDDSVAQLCHIPVAVEGASNVLTKLLERSRLMSYLEQSTRAIKWDIKVDGKWRYTTPPELEQEEYESLKADFDAQMDASFQLYKDWITPVQTFLYNTYRDQYPEVEEAAFVSAVNAQALDILRPLLPAAITSNLGMIGSAQSWEKAVIFLQAYPLREAQDLAAKILRELRKVTPTFMERATMPDRGQLWSLYFDNTRNAAHMATGKIMPSVETEGPFSAQQATLHRYDEDGEDRICEAILYEAAFEPPISLAQAREVVGSLPPEDKAALINAYTGERVNRRHRPGRAFESSVYTFDIVADYGIFRDLQRHRMLTFDWQLLDNRLGFNTAQGLQGMTDVSQLYTAWDGVMSGAAALYDDMRAAFGSFVSQYCLPLATYIRFKMELNARELMHLVELRTQKGGHESYRELTQTMYNLVKDVHPNVGSALSFVDEAAYPLARI